MEMVRFQKKGGINFNWKKRGERTLGEETERINSRSSHTAPALLYTNYSRMRKNSSNKVERKLKREVSLTEFFIFKTFS